MARPLEKDYGSKQTTITLPYSVWEALRMENINVSEECARYLTTLINHPKFKKKQNEKNRIEEILKFVDPDFLKAMKKRIRNDKNTVEHWKTMLNKKHNVEIKSEDLLKWSFEAWDSDGKSKAETKVSGT